MTIHWSVMFLKRLWFIFALVISSLSLKGQRKQIIISIVLLLCLMPIVLFVIITSTVLTAPLLPLFTLPIFIVGFPRPLRMWPQANLNGKSSSVDWIYYQQLTPYFVEEMRSKFSYCKLGPPTAGNYFLARFQDRLVWVTILESGFMYYNFVIKGLELQETSCHTTEAERIDEIFEFMNVSRKSFCNKYVNNVLTPKTVLHLNTYSDSSNILTGIIDNPETLKKISKMFPKVLLKVIMDHCLFRRQNGLEDVQSRYQLQDVDREEPAETKMTNISYRSDINRPDSASMINPFAKETTMFQLDALQNSREELPKKVTSENSSENAVKKDYVSPSKRKSFKIADTDSNDEYGNFGFGDDNDDDGDDGDNSWDQDVDQWSLGGDDRFDLNENNTKLAAANNPSSYAVAVVSKLFDPPSYWKTNLPFTMTDLSHVSTVFSEDWFNLLINKSMLEECSLIVKDRALLNIYKILLLTCFNLIELAGVTENSSVKEGPGHVYRIFHGKFPWSPHVHWLEEDNELKDLVVAAYRYNN